MSNCRDKPRLWIISKDSDYATKHEGKLFLNAALYQELAQLYRSEPEIYCFDSLAEGLKHFAGNAKVKADKLPSEADAEKITKEQESLPPLDWLSSDENRYVQFFISQSDQMPMLKAALRQLGHGVDVIVTDPPFKNDKKP